MFKYPKIDYILKFGNLCNVTYLIAETVKSTSGGKRKIQQIHLNVMHQQNVKK